MVKEKKNKFAGRITEHSAEKVSPEELHSTKQKEQRNWLNKICRHKDSFLILSYEILKHHCKISIELRACQPVLMKRFEFAWLGGMERETPVRAVVGVVQLV